MTILSLSDIQSGLAYLTSHPEYLLRCIINAARMRVGIPLDAINWLAHKFGGRKLPPDLTLTAEPPGVRISATLEVMGTRMALAATLTVEQILFAMGSIRVELRVRDLSIKPEGDSPMVQMLSMMDLSKPGDLLNFMPMRPAMILDAQGDLFILDLMKLPRLAKNERAQRIVAALSEVVAIRELGTEDDLLVVGLRAMPLGLMSALSHLRS